MPDFAEGQTVSLEARFESPSRRSRTSGDDYVKAVLRLTDDSTIGCVLWDASRVPQAGQLIVVSGEVGEFRGRLELRVASWRPAAAADRPLAHRIIDYYRACLAEENRSADGFAPGSRRLLQLGPMASPFGARSIELPTGSVAQRWVVDRRLGGAAETLMIGWRLVHKDGRMHPLLRTEAKLNQDHLSISGAVEVDDDGLEALGLDPTEREQLLFDFEDSCEDPVERLFSLLAELGFGPTDAAQEAIAVALGDEGSAITHYLLNDLDEMKALDPSQLAEGPIGVLFGTAKATPYPAAMPSPSVLPSNLEQERAITAALECPLTVVTGPPGTGKSQVLVNTAAAALARGERVLLASKNNHAIDVVTQRIDEIHDDAYVHRLGKKELREVAATALGSTLARPPVADPGLDQALKYWAEIAERVGRPYAEVERRVVLEARLAEKIAEYETLKRSLPDGVEPIRDHSDREYLLASYQEATRLRSEYDGAADRWFWQRRRRHRLGTHAGEAIRQCLSLSGSIPALTELLLAEGEAAVLAHVATLVGLSARDEERHQLMLEYETLPDDQEAQAQIDASFAERISPALELVAAGFRASLHWLGSAARASVPAYQAKLAASAKGTPWAARGAATGVVDAIPIWSVTSLAAGAALPVVPELFDLVIIDEATQSDIVSALPLLMRARRAMVLGDPQQLTHITSVPAGFEKETARRNGLCDSEADEYSYRAVSLFGLAASRTPDAPIMLRRHFRSHPDIIGFSNDMFYGGQLVVETDPSRWASGAGAPLEWIDVRGQVEPGANGRSARNRLEAERVFEVALRELATLGGAATRVGIVSPLRAQIDLLRDMVADRAPELAEALTIDTAHGFQGDERDVMIMSTVVGSGIRPSAARYCEKPNLVNVSVTRARDRLIVVGDHAACLASGSVLARLATYVEQHGDLA